ncbi:MAG: hypothetical protein Cons2KO_12130 [Congregibacter sp.]
MLQGDCVFYAKVAVTHYGQPPAIADIQCPKNIGEGFASVHVAFLIDAYSNDQDARRAQFSSVSIPSFAVFPLKQEPAV